MDAVSFRFQKWCLSFILLGLCLFPSTLQASDDIPRIEARMDRERLPVGGTANLTVEVSWEGEASALEFDLPSPPALRFLELVSSAQKSSVFRAQGKLHQVHAFIYKLKGVKRGEGEVGSVQVGYRRPGQEDNHQLRSEAVKVPVVSNWGMVFPSIGRTLLIFILLAVGLVLIGFYITWMIRRYRRRSEGWRT